MAPPPPPINLPELPDFLTGHVDPVFGADEPGGRNLMAGAEAVMGALGRGMPTLASAEAGADPFAGAEISRNAPCPCGSGQKYKHCHGAA